MCVVCWASEAQPNRLRDWRAFYTLDIRATWSIEFYKISDDPKPVANFLPLEVLVEHLPMAHDGLFWDIDAVRKRRRAAARGYDVAGGPGGIDDAADDRSDEEPHELEDGGLSCDDSVSDAWEEEALDSEVTL